MEMSADPSQMDARFETLTLETFQWSALARRIEEQDDLDPTLKRAALAAIPIVSGHFGQDWPITSFRNNHPLTESTFINAAPWTRERLVRIASELERAHHLRGWRELRNRIRDPAEANGALFELALVTAPYARDLP